MNTTMVTVVRIYLKESSSQVEQLLRRLHDHEQVRGVTMFKGASGFGDTNSLSSTLSYSQNMLNAPLVIEFFDTPTKINAVIEHIANEIKPRHMMWWNAVVNDVDE